MRTFLVLLAGCLAAYPADSFRVFVSTDLGGDPDDIQSLYRLAHYSDVLRVEGIVSSPGPGAKNSAAKIKEWLRRIDIEHIRRRGHPEPMTEAALLATVRQGAFKPGAPSPARVTEGSKYLIERAHAPDPEGKNRVLWVQAWGSLTGVAQALHDDPSIARKIRLYSIGSANTRADPDAREFILEGMRSGKWPDLWWLESGTYPFRKYDTFKGVHQGGDQSGEWHNEEYVKRNIRGRGGSHNGEFDQLSGDAFPLASYGEQHGTILKEGDSPAMLFLLSPALGGVGDVNDPTKESWGGQYRHFDRQRFPNYYVDLDLPAEECWKTVSKWRVAFLSDWKKRWQWYGTPRLPRLRVSADRRGLETETGAPFVWIGDTAWHLFARLDRNEAERYLLDRKEKKFTVIQAHLLAFSIDDRNANGDLAFHDKDFDKPNEAWFRHADAIVERAESLGLYMLLLPAWARNHIERTPSLASADTARRYGRFLGARYKDRTNVMWMMGGDVLPTKHEIYDALAQGLEEGAGYKPLMTYHPPGGTFRPPATSTGEFYHGKPWLDFNMIQSGHRRGNENYLRIAEDYARAPVKPTLDGEPCYEQHPVRHSFANGVFESWDVRQRAYWSVLAGAFGFTYGGNGIWQMDKPGKPSAVSHYSHNWDAALDHEGARQLRHLHRILEEYPHRVPDASILVTPQGAQNERLQAARAADSGDWLIYSTNGRDFEVKLPAVRGLAWWFNPRNGVRARAPWTVRQDPPGEPGEGNDWLLILRPLP